MHFKDFSHRAFWGRGITKTFWRVMKLTGILMLIALLHVSAAGLSQKVTLSVKNAPLEKVFDQIKQQTGLSFLWDEQVLTNTAPVTLNVKDATISDVLDACLKNQGLSYSMIQNMVVIKKSVTETQNPVDNIPPPIDIHGHVTDSLGNPLAGASVSVKGSKRGTTTDANGDFVLHGVNENAQLTISFTGYNSKIVKLNGSNSLTVALSHSTNLLDQVQIIAYGTTTQRLTTGDQTTVTSDVIERQPVSNPIFALEGRVPGLTIIQNSGVQGGGFTVQIRGRNSIARIDQNYPLYVVDGVPYSTNVANGFSLGNSITANTDNLNPLNFINPLDIESIDILKDADATSIYGSQGANGVIIITTKKGKAGNTAVNANVYFGAGSVGHYMKLLNTPQYLMMMKEGFANDGIVPDITMAPELLEWDSSKYTNWQKKLIGGNAQTANAQLTISGGSKNTQFSISGNYRQSGTVYEKDYVDKTSSIKVSLNNISDNQKFKTNIDIFYLFDNNYLPSQDLTSSSLLLPPNAPDFKDPNGNLIFDPYYNFNPYTYEKQIYTKKGSNLNCSGSLRYQIIPELEVVTDFGYGLTTTNEILTKPLSSFSPAYGYTSGMASYITGSKQILNIEPQISWKKLIWGGKLNVLLGSTFREELTQNNLVDGDNYLSDLLLNDMHSAGLLTGDGSQYIQYRYTSIFGRVNYNFKDKYIINLTARRDGSSRFSPDKQFANFGSMGAAWIFTNEEFFKKNLSFLSFGKIRGSYGTTGNDKIPDYGFVQLWGINSYEYQNSPTLYPSNINNLYYSWETVRKSEIGLDLGFSRDRILIGASYYNNLSDNQLVGFPLPPSVGFTSVQANLPANVRNNGFELILTSTNIKNSSFTWTTSFNISFPRNKLLAYPGLQNSAFANTYTVGRSLFNTKTYHYLRVDPATGVYQYQSIQGDSSTNAPSYPGDLQASKEVAQDFSGGFENSFKYKGFDLDFLFQFVKQTGYNPLMSTVFYAPGSFTLANQPVEVLSRWQKPGDNTAIQKFTSGYGDFTAFSAWFAGEQYGDNHITDASFIRLKNISLSYHLPNSWLQKVKLSQARIYIQAQNLFTITSFKGLDPESGGAGNGLGQLPPLKVITAGIQLIF